MNAIAFEAANEQWGAGFYHDFSIGGKDYTSNTEVDKWSSSAAEFEAFQNKCYDIIEEIGQYYVDKIRAQGGKNDDIKWMTNVLDNCNKYNYCPLIWECNDYFKRGWKRVKISDWESQDVKCELGFVDSDVAELFKSRSYAVEKAALTSE